MDFSKIDFLDIDFNETMKNAPIENEEERQQYFMDVCRKIVEYKKRNGYMARAIVDSMGCQMSFRDGEKLLGILEACGFTPAKDVENSDLIIFTTCTVRENANEKLYGRLGRLKPLYNKNRELIIGVSGCMMQEDDEVDKMRKKFPYVKLIFGTHNVYKLAEFLFYVLMKGKRSVEVLPDTDLIVENLPVHRKFKFKASVNITYGCNNFCTYCIVPYVRGREKSRNAYDIMRECESLVRDGVNEIMLLGQNVNSYGNDLKDSVTFPELLKMVAEIPGLKRLRFMTSNPKDFTDELINVIKTHKNIARHIHLPLQSGSTEILKKMNRKYTQEGYKELVSKIRKELPDVSLTTDIIVGFPGETEEDFNKTLEMVEFSKFDSAFTFIYSRRKGTVAAKWDLPDPSDVKIRFNRLLKVVSEVSSKNEGKDEGKIMEVLVEDIDRSKEGYVTGRLSNNILVHFPGDKSLVGSMQNVKLLKSMGFYYYGELVKDRV